MKITILLKSRPSSAKAARALKVTADMMSQGHAVNLYLLQDAVRFAGPDIENAPSAELNRLVAQGLTVEYLSPDAALRGMDDGFLKPDIPGGTYDTLVDRLESSDRVIGLL